MTDAQAFDDFVAGFNLPNFAYDESLSNAVRHNRTPRVFTANEAPQEVEIFLHHEMAQTPYYPSHLFFFCEQAAVAAVLRHFVALMASRKIDAALTRVRGPL